MIYCSKFEHITRDLHDVTLGGLAIPSGRLGPVTFPARLCGDGGFGDYRSTNNAASV